MTRPPAIPAATALIQRDFPDCLAAFMGGSVVRGEATATSDLDLIIIVPEGHQSYRESLHAFGWPMETFVHTPAMHRHFTNLDAARRSASTSRMVCEGIILLGRDGWAERFKEEACTVLASGPAPLTEQELASARYFVSDLMDDLTDARPDTAPLHRLGAGAERCQPRPGHTPAMARARQVAAALAAQLRPGAG